MSGVYLILSLLLATLGAGALFWSIKSYRLYKTNLLVSEELDKIIASTLETIHKAKSSASGKTIPLGEDIPTLLDSPDLMSTIITVLVNKYGTVRLSMKDFMIADEEYVSVYVDTNTQELLLSLDHDLVVDEIYPGFKNPTDNTFH